MGGFHFNTDTSIIQTGAEMGVVDFGDDEKVKWGFGGDGQRWTGVDFRREEWWRDVFSGGVSEVTGVVDFGDDEKVKWGFGDDGQRWVLISGEKSGEEMDFQAMAGFRLAGFFGSFSLKLLSTF
ncbi:hypothetical protein OIU79_021339 [Salix purpurea]|uniref:Uncharacterized protein n=1 Tax=Salix purpurea TaxID=77065 RepID=A0A9Q1AGT5_SALPP|nr:hypothetical protein OIU79_021339 [Salix purpurea]